MSSAPLLPDQDADADLELEAQRDSKEASRWGSVREFLEHWWSLTNDEGYLRPLFGRRRIGSMVMPAVLGLGASVDLLSIAMQPSELSAVYLVSVSFEVTLFFIALLAWRFDLASKGLLWDVVMSLCGTACYAVVSLHTPRALIAFTMATVFLYLFVQFFIGVRPAFIAASAGISVYVDVVIDNRNGGMYSQQISAAASSVVFILPQLFGLDYILALGFKRSEEQLIQSRMLERGCDGYFALNTETGIVVSASRGMIALLGDEFRGGKLVDVVRNKDKAKIVELCGRSNLSDPMVATLFSARSAGATVKEFDAKLTPIHRAGLDVYLILQLAGEVREVNKAERPPPPAGGRSARQRRAVAGQDCAASGSGPRDRPQNAVPEAAMGGGGDGRSPRGDDGSSEDAGREEEGEEQNEAGASEAAAAATPANCEEVLVRNLWLKFNAGGNRFELQDGCEELLPLVAGKGLLDYIPSAFRSGVEAWVMDEVTAFEAGGERPIPVSLLGFELSLPIWVLNARMAWLEVLPSQTDEGNVVIFPVVIHLQGVRAKRRPTSLLDSEGHTSDEDVTESASQVGNKFIRW